MAKVGRASRNASLLRVESLDGASDKTIQPSESGEVYLLAGNPGSDCTVHLPAAKAGAYIKFLVTVEADTAGWIIRSPDTTTFIGGAVVVHKDSDDTTVDVPLNGTSHVRLTLNADTNPGTFVEFISDGTTWFASGVVIGSVAPAAG